MSKVHKLERYHLVNDFNSQLLKFETAVENSEWSCEYEFEKILEGIGDLRDHLHKVLCAEYEEEEGN